MMADAAVSKSRTPQLSRQYETVGKPQSTGVLLGQPDMWVFVLLECLVFGSYFIIYMLYRMRTPKLFLESQGHLSQHFGVANTLILLTSSWLIARCVQSARENKHDIALGQLYMTMFCGALFVASKIAEWSMKIGDGYTFATNEFFWFYYFLTGIHVTHVLMGFGALLIVGYQLWGPERRSLEIIETGATYWHMVDFLWVIIFALLYVMR